MHDFSMRLIHQLIKKNKYPFLQNKRERFAVQSIILTFGLLVTQLIWQDFRFPMVIILSVLAYLLTIWSLCEDIKKIEWIMLFILPVFFTAATSLFYFLLPERWFTRLVIGSSFAIGSYAILLIGNIYNVSAERSIQLLRVAQSVGLLITLAIVFLSSSIIFSIRANFLQNFILIMPIIFILSLQNFWAINLEDHLNAKLFIYSLVVSLGVGELTLALSFYPVEISTAALFVTASFYAMVGIIQQYFLERLFKNTIREYIITFIFTMLIVIWTTKWG